jgi:hypothetical protein
VDSNLVVRAGARAADNSSAASLSVDWRGGKTRALVNRRIHDMPFVPDTVDDAAYRAAATGGWLVVLRRAATMGLWRAVRRLRCASRALFPLLRAPHASLNNNM